MLSCLWPFLQNYDVAKIINDKGCLQAGEEWMERNLIVVVGVLVGIAFLQVNIVIPNATFLIQWLDINGVVCSSSSINQ